MQLSVLLHLINKINIKNGIVIKSSLYLPFYIHTNYYIICRIYCDSADYISAAENKPGLVFEKDGELRDTDSICHKIFHIYILFLHRVSFWSSYYNYCTDCMIVICDKQKEDVTLCTNTA